MQEGASEFHSTLSYILPRHLIAGRRKVAKYVATDMKKIRGSIMR
jgi:hypothetical protein